ncbi:helix-turn-helix domain-containing protein [Actinoplanes sp. NPDC051851]|uniref:helix-turn-helix domain-containing protein n=1 Tax=Actinoplanes sp. NPDC051851 TaxID=3154753 RepID=UPI00341EF9DE
MSDPVEMIIQDVRDAAGELATRIGAEAPAGPSHDWAGLVRTVLTGLAERRPPTEAELSAERRSGLLRAAHGVPLDQVVAAYHLGFRRIWEELLAYAGTPRPDGLLDLAGLLWSWLPALAGAAAEGAGEAARRQREDVRRDTGTLVDLLATGQAGTGECRALAHRLGFDPDGDFQVTATPAPGPPAPGSPQPAPPAPGSSQPGLAAAGSPQPGSPVAADGDAGRWVIRDGRILVLAQAGVPHEPPPGPVTGTSLVRPGLDGAAAALLDAASALDLAVALGRPVDFRTDWLWITMLRHLDRLRPLLVPGRPADQPQLGAAARAYGDGGWSIAGAAVHLGLHPNTVRSRLDRLGRLARLDPRSIAGQRLSVLQDLATEVDAARSRAE